MSLDKISAEAIPGVNIPTGLPLVYTFDAAGAVTNRSYLGDPERTEKAQAELDGARPS